MGRLLKYILPLPILHNYQIVPPTYNLLWHILPLAALPILHLVTSVLVARGVSPSYHRGFLSWKEVRVVRRKLRLHGAHGTCRVCERLLGRQVLRRALAGDTTKGGADVLS
jgi:hypothetical protein